MSDEIVEVEQEGAPIENVESVSELKQETDTPAESAPEQKPNDATPAVTEDKPNNAPQQNVPFHEDPKVQDYIKRQVEQRLKESEGQRAPVQQPAQPTAEQTNIPSWFAGDRNDPRTLAAWKEYEAHLSGLTVKAKQEAIAEIKAQGEAEAKRVKEAQEWFQQSIAGIETENKTQLTDSDRNKLMKFVYDEYIVDDQGRWNYGKAFKFMKAMEQANKPDPNAAINARKQIAAKDGSDGKPEAKKPGIVSSDQAKRMSWDD